jgi:hypothetical protein
MAEGCMVKLRPNAAPIGCYHQKPPIIAQHTPAFAEQPPGVLSRFQPMHQQNPVKAQIREGQRVFLGQQCG